MSDPLVVVVLSYAGAKRADVNECTAEPGFTAPNFSKFHFIYSLFDFWLGVILRLVDSLSLLYRNHSDRIVTLTRRRRALK